MSTNSATTSFAATLLSPAWRARLGSIIAFAPLSVWTINHLFENLLAWGPAETWEAEVTGASGVVQELLISFFVVVPLILHTIWGLKRMRKTNPADLKRAPYFEHLRFVLQRLSAIGVLFFIPAHLFLARIRPALTSETGHIKLQDFAHEMSNAPTFIVYVLGVLGVTFHLANGIWGFVIHMGWVQGVESQRRLRNMCIVLFLILLAAGWGAIAGVRSHYSG